MIDSRLQIAENQEDIAKAFEGVSEDLGYKVKVIYTDPSKSPQLTYVDKDGNVQIKNGAAYVDKATGINYILINSNSEVNQTTAGVIGTIAEEQSHIIGKIEGRQKTVPDGSEKGLESLGRPTNDYFKNQYSKNDKVIGIVSDGKDYSNVDFGENVGDSFGLLLTNPYTAGIVGVSALVYATLPEKDKEAIKKVTMEVYEDIKEKLSEFGNNIKISYVVAKTLIEEKLREKGIIADVKIDKDGNIMYTMIPVPEEKRVFKLPPFPLPEEEKNPQLPPMEPPKQETQKERWEREERDRREQKERDNERSKPNGIPLQQERPVTVYYTEKTKKEREKVKTKGEILEEIGKADQKLDVQEGIKKQNRNFKKRRVYETKEGYIIYADDFHSKVEYEVFKNGKHVGTIPAETIIENGFHKEDIDTSKKDPKKRIDK